MKEFWEKVKSKCLNGNVFTLNHKNESMTFVPKKVNEETTIYNCKHIESKKTELVAIVKEGIVYLTEVIYPRKSDVEGLKEVESVGLLRFRDVEKEINSRLIIEMEKYYDTISIPKVDDDRLKYIQEKYDKDSCRQFILQKYAFDIPFKNDMNNEFYLFKTSECCDIFCGVIDEQRAIKQHIESNKLRIEVLKENNNDKEYVFSNHLYTEEWEMQLAKAVENNSCVTVIFKIDDKLAEIEMPSHNVIERLISTPHEWGYFETYDFVLEGGGCKSGIREQKIIDKLGRKPNCEDIVEIRANGKVTYRK